MSGERQLDESGVNWVPLYEAAGRAAAARDAGRRALARAHRLIDAEYARDLDLERLAAEAGYSPAHFLRRYADVYGDTPVRALSRHRMLAARQLLATTELSVTDVCAAVGFASLASFSHRFRSQFGQPPSTWRRRVWSLQADAGPSPPIPTCFAARFADA